MEENNKLTFNICQISVNIVWVWRWYQEYLVPLTQLLKEHPDVSGKELTMSFSGVNIICKLHEDLLVQLQTRIVDWQSENSKVGDVLLNIVPPLPCVLCRVCSAISACCVS